MNFLEKKIFKITHPSWRFHITFFEVPYINIGRNFKKNEILKKRKINITFFKMLSIAKIISYAVAFYIISISHIVTSTGPVKKVAVEVTILMIKTILPDLTVLNKRWSELTMKLNI
jgi:hypothetical protein